MIVERQAMSYTTKINSKNIEYKEKSAVLNLLKYLDIERHRFIAENDRKLLTVIFINMVITINN